MSLSKEINKLFDDIEYKIEKIQKVLVDRNSRKGSKLPGGEGGGYQPIQANGIPKPPPKKV